MQYLEDIKVGHKVSFGSYHVTREEVLEFAGKYDPQPFHLDEEAGRNGPFGVLSASGWHTGSDWMKCYVAANKAAEAKIRAEGRAPAPVGPSPGIANLRWLKPVAPGDTISYRTTV
ncbi:MAG: hypothetical protein RL354_946, partial [Planctomycetota bacterium]